MDCICTIDCARERRLGSNTVLAFGFLVSCEPVLVKRIKIAKKYKKVKIIKEWSTEVAMHSLEAGFPDFDS